MVHGGAGLRSVPMDTHGAPMPGRPGPGDRERSRFVTLGADQPVWEEFYTVAPLVLVATVEADGTADVAPKHQATPVGHGRLFAFACHPGHATYRNATATGAFTVGFPTPQMVVAASLAAGPRDAEGAKPTLDLLSLSPARAVDGVLVEGCPVHLECSLDRVVDGLEEASLVVGRVVVAHVSDRVRISAQDDQQRLVEQAPLLAYLHPGRVASVHHSKEFPFHRGFRR